MNAVELLLKRQSCSKLIAPAPSVNELDTIVNAGLRAPDHGHLTPWHMFIIEGQGLEKLSQLYASASPADDVDKVKRAASLPFRAPLIIAVIAKIQTHPKVPATEQLLSAGCAVHAMQMAAFALGYGAIWRSGELCHADIVKKAFNCSQLDEIVGFLYIGTPEGALPKIPEIDSKQYITYF